MMWHCQLHDTCPRSRRGGSCRTVWRRVRPLATVCHWRVCPPRNAPRTRARYRPPICRRSFMRPDNPSPLAGRRRAWLPARRRRLAHRSGEVSNTGCRCRDFEGSCSESHFAGVSPRGCCHPDGAARSPSSVPCARRKVSRICLRSDVSPHRWSESPSMFHQACNRESVARASLGHTSGTTRKGMSFTRVPSLGMGGCAPRSPNELRPSM